MSKRVEIGQGVASSFASPFEAGLEAARTAMQATKSPAQLALVFSTTRRAGNKLLSGVREGLGGATAPPMIGCTTPFALANQGYVVEDGVVVTLLAAQPENLTAHIGVGQETFRDPDAAVQRALEESGAEKLLRQRVPGFLFVITPGFRYEHRVTSPGPYNSGDLVRLLSEKVQKPIVVFGGSAADDFQRRDAAMWTGYRCMRNALVLAFVETPLAFGFRLASELSSSRQDRRLSIDKLRGDSDIGQYVEKIQDQDAWPFVKELAADGVPLFRVGDAVHGEYVAQPFPAPDDAEGKTLFFPRKVSRYTYLRKVTPDRDEMVERARLAAEDALVRSETQQPALAMVVSCIGRPELFGNKADYAREEMRAVSSTFSAGVVISGFYGAGEHCGSLGQSDASANYATGVFVLGDSLYGGAQLVEKMHVLARVGAEIQIAEEESLIAHLTLNALNDLGYEGGMISFRVTDLDTHKTAIKAKYARNAANEERNQWESILGPTDRDVSGGDILAEVARPGGRSIVIGDSLHDPRCDDHAVELGKIHGQIVFPLLDPSQDDTPFGTLQIGIPTGHEPTRIELDTLSAFVHTIAHSIAVNRLLNEIRNQLVNLYMGMVKDTMVGDTIDDLLHSIVSGAASAVGADYASIRLVDESKGHLVFRAFHPRDKIDVWTSQRRKTVFPLDRQNGDGYSSIGQQVYHERRPYRTDGTDKVYFSCFFEDIVGDLSVPMKIGSDFMGILTVNSTNRHFAPAHEFSLSLFARMAAVAVMTANSQLRATTLNQVSHVFLSPASTAVTKGTLQQQLDRIVDIIKDALHCGSCSLFLVEPEYPSQVVLRATTSDKLKSDLGNGRYRFGRGLTGGVAKLRKSLRLSEIGSDDEMRRYYPDFYHAGVRWSSALPEWLGAENERQCEFLGVPILWRDDKSSEQELLGVIRCTKKLHAEHFFADDEKLLWVIADGIAVGLKQSQAISHLAVRDEWQRYFVRLSSHQMKSPITHAVQQLDMLKLDSEDKKNAIDCQRRLNRLLRLIDGLRLLQQAQGDYTSLQPETDVRIKSVVERSISDVEWDYVLGGKTSPDIEIVLQPTEGILSIEGYSVFLNQALINLISNALKASPPRGIVNVEIATHSSDELAPDGTFAVPDDTKRHVEKWREILSDDSVNRVVAITITDQGPGISEENVTKIFKPMRSIPVAGKQEGFGLGLTIVQQVAKAHGGAICVRSRYGHGATFTLVLPLND